jgi:uncharacterized Zn finger protein
VVPTLKLFSPETINKGKNYYKEGRVLAPTKFLLVLSGQNQGQEIYTTEVNLDSFENKCSCPLQSFCKHMVALLLAKDDDSTINANYLWQSLRSMDKDELISYITNLQRTLEISSKYST